jgi:hypothetical protein
MTETKLNLVSLAATLPVIHQSEFDQSNVDGIHSFIGDVYSVFIDTVCTTMTEGEGVPIVHIASPTALTVIQCACSGKFVRVTSDKLGSSSNLVGKLNGIPILIDRFANDIVPFRTIFLDPTGELTVSEIALKNVSFI